MDNLSVFYQFMVHEPSGLLIKNSGIVPAHSFTRQFAQILFNSLFELGAKNPVTVLDTAGASVTNARLMGISTIATTSVTTYGIQVGTGTAAESISDNTLQTKINQGSSAGQLQYGSMTYAAPTTTATTTTFRFTRVFTNASGGTVTVQEIGLASTFSAKFYLLVRDLTGAVAVNNGQQLTVNYDFTTTI